MNTKQHEMHSSISARNTAFRSHALHMPAFPPPPAARAGNMAPTQHERLAPADITDMCEDCEKILELTAALELSSVLEESVRELSAEMLVMAEDASLDAMLSEWHAAVRIQSAFRGFVVRFYGDMPALAPAGDGIFSVLVPAGDGTSDSDSSGMPALVWDSMDSDTDSDDTSSVPALDEYEEVD